MTTATVQKYEQISQIPGAAINLTTCRSGSDQVEGDHHFVSLLGQLTGRLEPSGIGGWHQRGEPAGWLKLADIDPAAIEGVVRQMRRSYPAWTLDGGKATTIVGKVDVHHNTLQERWRREQQA